MKTGRAWRAAGLGLVMVLAVGASAASGQALTNAGFEAGDAAGWDVFGQGWRVSSWSNEVASDAHGGQFGMAHDVREKEVEEWRGVSQAVPAEQRNLYTASAWIKALDVKDAEAFLELQFLDDDGKLLESTHSDAVKDDQPFTRVVVGPAEAPKRTETLLVRGIVHRLKLPDKTTDVFVFDDFELTVTNKSSKANGGVKLSPADRIRQRQQSRQGPL